MQEKGMPMLDYICLRKSVKQNTLTDVDVFQGKQAFLDAFQKWRKVFVHSRKKEFKFDNLVKYMRNT